MVFGVSEKTKIRALELAKKDPGLKTRASEADVLENKLREEEERKIKANETRKLQEAEVRRSQDVERTNLNEMEKRKSEESQEQEKTDQS